jgi:hypothetical protein
MSETTVSNLSLEKVREAKLGAKTLFIKHSWTNAERSRRRAIAYVAQERLVQAMQVEDSLVDANVAH